MHLAHLTPPGTVGEEEDWRVYPPASPGEMESFDLGAQVSALEEEIARAQRTREAKKDRERAILVQIDQGEFDAEERLDELGELARTAGAEVVYRELIFRRHLKPGTLIGAGKLEELTSKAYHEDADLLIFGQELGAAQAREIEEATGLKVLDRTQLILDIFALHAQGVESRLQVELAQLRYMKPRLLGAGSRLSRIGASGGSAAGGAIGTRGPGETKLELDRRRINDRLSFLEHQLKEVAVRREERRKQRSRNEVPVISIVGYTNAGKSTLLNAFTHAAEEPRKVLAENKLFATLRPTSRQGFLEGIGPVVYTDTVGFIRDLPTDLSRAFRATLEEIGDADMLLHVVDVPRRGPIPATRRCSAFSATWRSGTCPRWWPSTKPTRPIPRRWSGARPPRRRGDQRPQRRGAWSAAARAFADARRPSGQARRRRRGRPVGAREREGRAQYPFTQTRLGRYRLSGHAR